MLSDLRSWANLHPALVETQKKSNIIWKKIETNLVWVVTLAPTMSPTKSPTKSFTTASTSVSSVTLPPPQWYQRTPGHRGKVTEGLLSIGLPCLVSSKRGLPVSLGAQQMHYPARLPNLAVKGRWLKPTINVRFYLDCDSSWNIQWNIAWAQKEIQKAKPKGFLEGSGCISPCIPTQIQTFWISS